MPPSLLEELTPELTKQNTQPTIKVTYQGTFSMESVKK